MIMYPEGPMTTYVVIQFLIDVDPPMCKYIIIFMHIHDYKRPIEDIIAISGLKLNWKGIFYLHENVYVIEGFFDKFNIGKNG